MQITLSSLSPTNLRIAESDSPLLRVVEVPPGGSLDFLAIPELRTAGIYLLLDDTEQGATPLAVGAADDLGTLLSTWAPSAESLHTRLLITGRFSTLSLQTLARLEARLLQTLTTHRLLDRDFDARIRSLLASPENPQAEVLFEGAVQLLKVLGLRLFEVKNPVSQDGDTGLYYCGEGAVRARARRTREGFVVLKGSLGHWSNVAEESWATRLQRTLYEEAVLQVDGQTLSFTTDYVFKTAAQAASALTGSVTSGFFDWKTLEGRALGEIERYIDVADEPQAH